MQYDYIVIGAGSAGAVVANRLSVNPGNSVLLLEAGPADYRWTRIPVGSARMIINPAVNWLYSSEPEANTNGRRVPVPRGRMLGGSSALNGMAFVRGQAQDFDSWAQMGNQGWSYEDVLPFFKRMESYEGGGDDALRGRDGPLRVTNPEPREPFFAALIKAAGEVGIAHNPDYNGARQDGIAMSQATIARGRRMSTARCYLDPARKRPNLRIETGAIAEALLFEGKLCIGVRYSLGTALREARAAREVVVSGGTVNSPQLLELSGIGQPERLKALGIEVRHSLPGVGENLRDHYAPRFVARVKGIGTINERVRGLNLAAEVLKWAVARKGVLALSPTLVYCFWRSDPSVAISDVQLTFTPASYKEGVQSQLEDEPGMTVASWQQRPESRGWVRLRSSDPFEPPVIQPNYLAEESDRKVLLGAMKLARRLLASRPLAPYYEREDFPGPGVKSDDELLAAAKQRGTTTFHPMGTCRMGPESDPTAVVDDQLRVRGLEGLRVVDASVMPMMLSANLNAATMMIAEKASDMILGKAALEPVPLPEPA